jgi:hypothetical protein
VNNTTGSVGASSTNQAALSCIDSSGVNTTLPLASANATTTGGSSTITWTYTLPSGCTNAYIWMTNSGTFSYYSAASGTSFPQNAAATTYTAAASYPAGGAYPTVPTTGNATVGGALSAGTVTQTGCLTAATITAPCLIQAPTLWTAQSGNISNTTIATGLPAGLYRIDAAIAITQAATSSSTMPQLKVSCMDATAGSYGSYYAAASGDNTPNMVGYGQANQSATCDAAAASSIGISTYNYASSGTTPMLFKMRVAITRIY